MINAGKQDKDLVVLWTKLAFGITMHRYFLHVDPIFSQAFKLDFRQRSSILSIIDDTELVSQRKEDIKTEAEIEFHRNKLIKLPFVDQYSAFNFPKAVPENIAMALKKLATSPLKLIVELGALLFVPKDNSYSIENLVVYGAIPLEDKMSSDDALQAICVQATRNLFMMFLLAESMHISTLTDLKHSAANVEAEFGHLADEIALSSFTFLYSSNTQDFSEEFFPEKLKNNVPAADFASVVLQKPNAYEKYLSGIGIGQS
jgi:hypothetical protein